MRDFDWHLPTKIVFGKGRLSELAEKIDPGRRRILIVTDKTIASRTDALDRVRTHLAGRETAVFDGVQENPSFENVEAGSRLARDFEAELIFGLGGGSAMDAAKGIALKARNYGPLECYLRGDPIEDDPLPVVCVPTTAGTGSEVTPYAVFTDTAGADKVGFSHPKLFPELALIDPVLTYTMPETVVINTGLDVLAHAAEAYLSAMSYPLNDTLALHALETARSRLPGAARKNPDDMDHMAFAAMLAGIAIANASTILPHIAGYPLTVRHRVPHGRASAVMLAAVLPFLRKHSSAPEKIAVLDRMFGGPAGFGACLRDLGVPTKLSDYGVREEEIPLFVQKTIVKGDVKITPAEVTKEDLAGIYRSAL
jgi:alcohol dehydrogenase class IV